MNYEEEKKYLVEKAKEFFGNAEVVWLEDVKGIPITLLLTISESLLKLKLLLLKLLMGKFTCGVIVKVIPMMANRLMNSVNSPMMK